MLESLRVRSTPVSDSIRNDLVAMLIAGQLPILVMGINVLVVALLHQRDVFDIVATSAAVGIILLLCGRALVVAAFARLNRAGPLSTDVAHVWEVRFMTLVLPYGALFGLFNFQIVATGGEADRLLVVAATFGFCAGMVTRVYVRPQLCTLMVLMGALPTAAAMLVVALGRTGPDRLVYAVVGTLFIVYAVTSLQTVRQQYRTMLAQLATKHQQAILAHADPLTGLPNRLVMHERMATQGVEAGAGGNTVLLIDLDGFKRVNDSFGHPAGDGLLREVARRLKASVRSDDLTIRIGGDEFAIFQSAPFGAVDAERLSKRIIASLTQPFDYRGTPVHIGVSIGIATDDGAPCDLDALLVRADVALYQAKRVGGNAFRFWREGPAFGVAA